MVPFNIKDLIHWENKGIALKADTKYDSHGVYSGSALSIDEQLLLMYTGNVRNEQGERFAYQDAAWMDKNDKIKKEEVPLIKEPPTNCTSEFRDPQIMKIKDNYQVIIGSQTSDEHGKIAVYQGKELHSLHFTGFLNFTDNPTGFMIECPNLIEVNGQPVIIFCPQGLDHQILDYQNIYPNCYVIGQDLDWNNNTVKEPSSINNLDEGFDLYASQVLKAPDGRSLSVGWINLPDLIYPNDQDDWTGSLSLIKELTIKNKQLYQYPIAETKMLRQKKIDFQNEQVGKNFELELTVPANQRTSLKLFKTDHNYLEITINALNGIVTVDRSRTKFPLNKEFGEIRRSTVTAHQEIQLNIFVDNTICEIFINNGLKVQTLRYFSEPDANTIDLTGSYDQINVWELKK